MADKTDDDGRCVPCDIVFYGLATLAAVFGAVLIFDYVTDGKVSEYLNGVFRKGVALASVTSISGDSDSDAG